MFLSKKQSDTLYDDEKGEDEQLVDYVGYGELRTGHLKIEHLLTIFSTPRWISLRT